MGEDITETSKLTTCIKHIKMSSESAVVETPVEEPVVEAPAAEEVAEPLPRQPRRRRQPSQRRKHPPQRRRQLRNQRAKKPLKHHDSRLLRQNVMTLQHIHHSEQFIFKFAIQVFCKHIGKGMK